MKALTLHQPWASLIALGEKTIETRSWRAGYTGRIAIHAGKLSQERAEECQEEPYRSLLVKHGIKVIGDLPWGAVIATAMLVGYHRMDDDYVSAMTIERPDEVRLGFFAPGRYGWVLSDVEPFQVPVPARGYQGLWDWDPPTRFYALRHEAPGTPA